MEHVTRSAFHHSKQDSVAKAETEMAPRPARMIYPALSLLPKHIQPTYHTPIPPSHLHKSCPKSRQKDCPQKSLSTWTYFTLTKHIKPSSITIPFVNPIRVSIFAARPAASTKRQLSAFRLSALEREQKFEDSFGHCTCHLCLLISA